jgi:hypothetical protein
MKNRWWAIIREWSRALAPMGVLAFWAGMVLAARSYPSEFDWRYMPVSNLLFPDRNPAGYQWASLGLVLCSLCGLYWTVLLARGRAGKELLQGLATLQFGYCCMIFAVVLHPWLIRLERGHEFVSLLAFAGLCIGLVRLMFQVVEQSFQIRPGRFTGNARLLASIMANAAVFPIALAALAQAYVHFGRPELHWVNLSWRDKGVPLYLSFDFWEWLTCFMISAYMVVLSQVTRAVYPAGSTREGR